MPTLAARIAAASLAPSPTIAVTMVVALQRLHYVDLVLGRHPREDEPRGHRIGPFLGRQLFPFAARDHLIGRDVETQLGGDDGGGHRMIAGDQPHADVTVAQLLQQRAGTVARRVGQPD